MSDAGEYAPTWLGGDARPTEITRADRTMIVGDCPAQSPKTGASCALDDTREAHKNAPGCHVNTQRDETPHRWPVGDADEVRWAVKTRREDQPLPTPNAGPDAMQLVIEDVKKRRATGVEPYGTTLQPHNGRDPLCDAYEEAPGLAAYLRQCVCERDGGPS